MVGRIHTYVMIARGDKGGGVGGSYALIVGPWTSWTPWSCRVSVFMPVFIPLPPTLPALLYQTMISGGASLLFVAALYALRHLCV